jgi:SH3-like domain-containing protein
MARYISLIILLMALSFLCVSATAQTQKTMSVQVKETQLRVKPSYLGKIVVRAPYGARVTILEERGDWKRAAYGSYRGWMHKSSLTTKRIVLTAGKTSQTGTVGQDEIALAGKGFNKEVENRYRANNRNLDYTWINRMEAFSVTSQQIDSFVSEGRLSLGNEGG